MVLSPAPMDFPRLTDVTPELLDACRNMAGFARIRDGDQVLIAVDETTDNRVYVRALRQACEEQGAGDVAVLRTKRPKVQFDAPTPFVQEVLRYADVIFSMGGYNFYTEPYGLRAMQEYGVKIVRVDLRHPEQLVSEFCQFPVELLYAVVGWTVDRVCSAKKLRVTTRQGTDLTCGINPYATSGGQSPTCIPGDRVIFPGGMVGVNPQDPVNGVMVFDVIHPNWNPPQIMLDAPLRITVQDRLATKIEGEHADWVEELLRTRGDENSRYLAEVMWGNHPKGFPIGWPHIPAADWFRPFHYRPDTLHCALGRGIADYPPYSSTHLDFYMLAPTVHADDTLILDAGRHMAYEDPKIRAVAEKYGDPDELLRLVELPEGFLAPRATALRA